MLAAVERTPRRHRFASMRHSEAILRDAVKAAGVSLEVVALDVTDRASVNAAVAGVVARGGRLDVLVNNAGVGIHGPIEEVDDDEVARVFDTNVFGLLRVTRAAVPQMRSQGNGTVVNVGSLAGKVSAPFGGVYSASKHAVEAISDSLHFELHPFGVRVVLVEPGGFETRFGDNRILERRFGEGSPYAELERRFAQSGERLPGAGQRGEAQTVANVIVDAAKAEQPKRRYLVGQDAEMIGGLHKQMSDEDFEKAMRSALDFWD
jgi:NAD(P)-dependent dehydrogenase (short-subunit alcohol dehydrogenase family)